MSTLRYNACETWAPTKIDEKAWQYFERKILRQIFGPKRDHNTEEYEWRTNQ